MARTTIQSIQEAELTSQVIKTAIKEFHKKISMVLHDVMGPHQDNAPNMYLEDVKDSVYEPNELGAEMPEVDAYDLDAFLQAQVQLPKGDGYRSATVMRRKHDADGNPIGRAHSNPILDTRIFGLQFEDGHVEDYAVNVLAKNFYGQVDEEGHYNLLLQEIIDHQMTDEALCSH